MKRCSVLLLMSLALACSQEKQAAEEETKAGTLVQVENVRWRVPATWVTETPSSGFRKGQYRLPRAEGDPEDATCVVFYFRGEGGAVQANLERWSGQFEQPDGRPSREVAKIERTEVNGLKQTRMDLTGTYLFSPTPMMPPTERKPGFRLLAAVIETSTGPWFVKLVGPEKTVAKWEGSFFELLESFGERASQ